MFNIFGRLNGSSHFDDMSLGKVARYLLTRDIEEKHYMIGTDLGQGSEALLLDIPDELVARELQALLHVQLRNVHTHQQPALRALRALALHYATPSIDKQRSIVTLKK